MPTCLTRLYRLYDGEVLLYIGISCDVFRRMREHEKDKPWFSKVTKVVLGEEYSSRYDAEAAEKKAIITESPRWNLIHKKKAKYKKFENEDFSFKFVQTVLDMEDDETLEIFNHLPATEALASYFILTLARFWVCPTLDVRNKAETEQELAGMEYYYDAHFALYDNLLSWVNTKFYKIEGTRMKSRVNKKAPWWTQKLSRALDSGTDGV